MKKTKGPRRRDEDPQGPQHWDEDNPRTSAQRRGQPKDLSTRTRKTQGPQHGDEENPRTSAQGRGQPKDLSTGMRNTTGPHHGRRAHELAGGLHTLVCGSVMSLRRSMWVTKPKNWCATHFLSKGQLISEAHDLTRSSQYTSEEIP